MDQEAALNTIKATIEPITDPFDHSEITITVDFDFWKFNDSHLENDYFKRMIRKELLDLVIENQSDDEQKSIAELRALNPEERQNVKLNVNPHETRRGRPR